VRFPYAAWVAAIARHYRAIVVASLVVCVLSALSLMRLRLDIDVLHMLPQGTPAFDDFKTFVADFGELNQLVILVQGEPPLRMERFADAFGDRLRTLDTVKAVQARIDVGQVLDGLLGRYPYNYLSEKDYTELASRLTPEGIDAQVAADRILLSTPFDLSTTRTVLQDPLGIRRLAAAELMRSVGPTGPTLRSGYLVSPDGHALLMLVRPTESAFDIAFSERLLRQVRTAEAQTQRALSADGIRVDYTGSYVYALEDAGTLKQDVMRYTALALLGVLAVFYLGYRNLRILPFVTYPLVVTTLLTFALSLLLFDELNAVSISFAAILYGLSIDSAIYFYTRLLQERRQQADLQAAVTATLAGLGRANLAASITTAAAFAVIGFSCLEPVRQLGLLTALGMLLTTVEFFTLYPALGFFLSRSVARAPEVSETRRLARCAEAAAAHARALTVVAAAFGVLLLVLGRHVSLDVALTHLRPRDSDAARVQREVSARFGDPEASGAVLVRRADLEDALADSEKVARRLHAYQAEGRLRAVQSIDGVVPSAHVQRVRLDRYNRLPRARAVAELRGALARHGFVPERFEAFFADFLRPRKEIVRLGAPALAPLNFLIEHYVRERAGEYIVATYVTPSPGVSWQTVERRLRQDLGGLAFTVAARGLLENELGAVLHRELRWFFVLGLAGNFLLLLIAFGVAGTALSILAPVVLVIVALFALMEVTGIALDPVNLVVTPLIFGIGVDYGVYIAARARERSGVPEAIRYAGRAVVVTSLTTISGFGFLALSRYPPLASMGLLTAVGLFLCLVLSIMLLPALLSLRRPV
jgi:uncharacterized protein